MDCRQAHSRQVLRPPGPHSSCQMYLLSSRAEWKRGIGYSGIIKYPAGNLTLRIASSVNLAPRLLDLAHANTYTHYMRMDWIEYRNCFFLFDYGQLVLFHPENETPPSVLIKN